MTIEQLNHSAKRIVRLALYHSPVGDSPTAIPPLLPSIGAPVWSPSPRYLLAHTWTRTDTSLLRASNYTSSLYLINVFVDLLTQPMDCEERDAACEMGEEDEGTREGCGDSVV